MDKSQLKKGEDISSNTPSAVSSTGHGYSSSATFIQLAPPLINPMLLMSVHGKIGVSCKTSTLLVPSPRVANVIYPCILASLFGIIRVSICSTIGGSAASTGARTAMDVHLSYASFRPTECHSVNGELIWY